jgi:hypothetical protein
MFEIRCIVADKRLADVLHSLRNLTLEAPVVVPIAEHAQPPTLAHKTNSHNGRSKLRQALTQELMKYSHINSKEIAALAVKLGGSSHIGSLTANLRKDGVLKKSRGPGYDVIARKD